MYSEYLPRYMESIHRTQSMNAEFLSTSCERVHPCQYIICCTQNISSPSCFLSISAFPSQSQAFSFLSWSDYMISSPIQLSTGTPPSHFLLGPPCLNAPNHPDRLSIYLPTRGPLDSELDPSICFGISSLWRHA